MAEQNGLLNIGNGAIPGNATVKGYEDQTVVQAMSYGITQGGEWEEGDQVTGHVTHFGELAITKVMDNGSPTLAHSCAMKTQYDNANAELNLVSGSDAYLTIILEKVIITSVSVNY